MCEGSVSTEWEFDYFLLRRAPVVAYLLVADSGFVFYFYFFRGISHIYEHFSHHDVSLVSFRQSFTPWAQSVGLRSTTRRAAFLHDLPPRPPNTTQYTLLLRLVVAKVIFIPQTPILDDTLLRFGLMKQGTQRRDFILSLADTTQATP